MSAPKSLYRFENLKRSPSGSAQISEFGVALFFLFALVVLPLINLCVVPLRWSLGKSMVGSRVHQLAQMETLSQAFLVDRGDSKTQAAAAAGARDGTVPEPRSTADMIEDELKKIGGISVKSTHLALTIESSKMQGQTKTITKVGSIPKDWLPDGSLGPHVYRLELTVEGAISPLFVLAIPGLNIPGLTAPFAVQFHDSSVFENTGRDPVSGEFYLNE